MKQRGQLASVLKEMGLRHSFIDSTGYVNTYMKEEHQTDIKPWIIRDVMKSDLDMRYKKVKPVSIHANSPKNLVLRQEFGLKYIGLLL